MEEKENNRFSRLLLFYFLSSFRLYKMESTRFLHKKYLGSKGRGEDRKDRKRKKKKDRREREGGKREENREERKKEKKGREERRRKKKTERE